MEQSKRNRFITRDGITDHKGTLGIRQYGCYWRKQYNDPVGMMLDISCRLTHERLGKGGKLGVKGANAAIPDLKPQVLNPVNQSIDVSAILAIWIESLDPYSGMIDMARLGTYGLREKQAADYVVNDYREILTRWRK